MGPTKRGVLALPLIHRVASFENDASIIAPYMKPVVEGRRRLGLPLV